MTLVTVSEVPSLRCFNGAGLPEQGVCKGPVNRKLEGRKEGSTDEFYDNKKMKSHRRIQTVMLDL